MMSDNLWLQRHKVPNPAVQPKDEEHFHARLLPGVFLCQDRQ